MSRYCTRCGAQLDENMRFCTNCGQAVAVIAPTVQPNTPAEAPTGDPNWNPDQPAYIPPMPPQPKKSKKGLVIGLICGLAALIAAIVGAIVIINNGKQIKLDEYLVVEYSGYNGYGTARVSYDQERFLKDNMKKFKKSQLMSQESAALVFAESTWTMGSLDKYNDLSNGDELHFTWSISPEEQKLMEQMYGVRMKFNGKDFSVEGLTEVGSFDPFEYLDLSFEGNNGHGWAILDTKNNPYDYSFYYNADPIQDLTNGDTITVTCVLSGDESGFVREYGVRPTSLSKTFQVEGLGEIQEFDPFDYVVISYEGISPLVSASASFAEDAPDYVYAYWFEESYFSNLADGQEFEVKLSTGYSQEDLEITYGVRAKDPDNLTKTYTVSGVEAYVSGIKQVSDEALKAMRDAAKVVLEEQLSSLPDGMELSKSKYQGMYMLLPKNKDQIYNQYNYIYMVYKNTIKNGSDKAEYYTYVAFDNMTIDGDGKCTIDTSRYYTSNSTVSFSGTTLYGYDSLESFKTNCVDYNEEYYVYETDME